MRKLLVLDNYDSFTYNLVHFIREHGGFEIDVVRNDQIAPSAIEKYDRIVLSPGPGLPDEAGILKEVIRRYAPSKKILGVCLGMQAMAEVFGGSLLNLQDVFHGMSTPIYREPMEDAVLQEIPEEFMGGRYHSWVINEKDFPEELVITSRDSEGNIMSLHHKSYPLYGLQFHPESILTPDGKKMINNFLNL